MPISALLLGPRHHVDTVVENARQQRLFLDQGVEVRRLGRGLEMAGARVLAVDALVRNQRLEERDRPGGGVEQPPRAPFAEAPDEGRGVQLQPREHLTAVARACPPADRLSLEDQDAGAGAGQMAGGGQTGVAGADNGDVDAARGRRPLRIADCGLRIDCRLRTADCGLIVDCGLRVADCRVRKRVKPERVFVHRPSISSATGDARITRPRCWTTISSASHRQSDQSGISASANSFDIPRTSRIL